MIVQTAYLDRAAFLMCIGGNLTQITGHYPENIFHIKVSRLQLWYEKFIGWIGYKRFGSKRRIIKTIARKQDGLPSNFLGKNGTGFNFLDVAHS